MSDVKTVHKPASQKKRLLLFALCSLAALAICTTIVITVALSMITDGVYEGLTDNSPQSLNALPQTPGDAVSFLNLLTEDTQDNNAVFVDIETRVEIDDDTLTIDGTDSELAVLRYMKNNLLTSIDDLYAENYEGAFGKAFTDFPTVSLTSDDAAAAVCSQGFEEQNGTITDDDFYFFDITVPGGDCYPVTRDSRLYETFNMADVTPVIEKIKEASAPLVNVISHNIVPGDFSIKAKTNRFSNQLGYLDLIRRYSVSLTLEFLGDFASLGTKTIGFEYSVTEAYNYTWAGISFSENSITIEQGDNIELAVAAVMNDNEAYDIRFESSDSSTVSVDEMGYITGIRESKEPVAITVYLTYLNRTYTAECDVYVMTAVTKIKISDDELTLRVGESAELSATVKPKNATNSDIIWVCEEDSAASVSESGVVTANTIGTATVIAVSADGHFMDSCTVTVTE